MTLRVIKIGTSILRGQRDSSTSKVITHFCSTLSRNKKYGDKIVLVSSGAVGLGCSCLNLYERPKDLVSLQAAAAIGQGQLMSLYDSAMSKHNINIAQVLLTRSDFDTKGSYRNAIMTIQRLLDWDILPIINENDVLSPEELKYGDNDTLSALVASAIKADELILLTDIDKLYSSDPKIDIKAEPINEVKHFKDIKRLEYQSSISGEWGKGGIKTKLSAARIATENGIKVHLADGRNPKNLDEILKGSRIGTVFHPSTQPIGSRKSWLAHALKPLGNIYIDNGASNAIRNNGASLLIVGIKKIEGHFQINQPVRILNLEGEELAKGLTSINSEDLRKAHSENHFNNSPVVIHRDVLVLTGEDLIR